MTPSLIFLLSRARESKKTQAFRAGAGEEIVNAHLSLGLEIIPIVHRNYDGWTIRWSLQAHRPTRDHEFESDFLQRGACCLFRSRYRLFCRLRDALRYVFAAGATD